MEQLGLWYDGQSAQQRSVRVSQGPGELLLTDESGSEHAVAKADLVRLGSADGRVRFGRKSSDGWRLTLVEPIDPDILADLPRRLGSVAPVGSRKMVALLGGLSIAATLLAGVVIFAPEAVAKHMPLAWERKLGTAFDLPIEATRCDDAGAQESLNAIVDRLDPQARKDGFTVELIELDEANAAALPGGRMVVLSGLFDDIKNPDALAGIVAHEIAHVRRRHVAAAMVRQLGLGTVVTLLGGGAVASNAGGLLSLKFSRTAEAEADSDAIAMLRHAGIDPRPTASAFDEFRKQEGDWPEWLGDHPASAARARLFKASYDSRQHYRPVLDPARAKQLVSACHG
ncbi:M48 family metallopeptidase [Sphingomonas sp.]|uniref:M48 family metallopeptidase n=1 Tax=Sphingomonas sp. TaxID=28214 RepID=UPI0025CD32C5|nr:M48 family metallopeptidase [Sphingomonas sp.]